MNKSKKTYPNKRAETVTGVIFLAAMVLAIIGIDLYRHTIINWVTLVPVVLLGIVVGFIFLWKPSRSFTNKFWSAFNCSMTGGAVFYFLFLFLNSQFLGEDVKVEQFNVVDSGLLAGKYPQPFFYIDFHGEKKQLVFRGARLEHPLEQYKHITLVYQTGLLGFEYITDKEAEVE